MEVIQFAELPLIALLLLKRKSKSLKNSCNRSSGGKIETSFRVRLVEFIIGAIAYNRKKVGVLTWGTPSPYCFRSVLNALRNALFNSSVTKSLIKLKNILALSSISVFLLTIV